MKCAVRSRCVGITVLVVACGSGADVARTPPPNASPLAATSIPPPLPNGRLPATATPTHYALSLVVDPSADRFTGDVTIDVDVRAATGAIVLHARELTVLRAEALVESTAISARAESRAAAAAKEGPEELVLLFERSLPAGKAQLRIAYSAPLANKLAGLYSVKESGAAYAFTQFEPSDARRAFPCFDEPGYKTPFDIRVTTPKGNVVVANTPEQRHVDSDDGKRTMFTFATTPPLPTYLVAIAVGPFEIREGAKGPVAIRLIATRGKTKLGGDALETAAAHVRLLGDYFDRPYPYPKLDLVAVPDFAYGAMENAGLITFREEALLVDPASASTKARRNMALAVAHELAHHWFGDLVTMSWWDDIWLNEGFATWMESKIVDQWRPSMDARLEALGAVGWVMNEDALDSARAVRQRVSSTSDAEEAFDDITYVKGAAVLGMLEGWLGPDVFRAGIRGYIKAHEHGSATSADLFRAVTDASGKDVVPVASTFLDMPGVPLVGAELACEGGKPARVRLTQARYRARPVNEEAPAGTWRIPICIAFEGAQRPACGVLDRPTGEIALGVNRCPRWIDPNAQEQGYYRYRLAPGPLAALAAAGNALDSRSRIGIVANAWALVQSGDLPSDSLLDLLAKMRRERKRLVVEQIIATLDKISLALVDEGARPAFRSFASSILLPIAKELGWDTRKADTDDQKLMRLGVLSALATFATDPWMSAEADKRAASYLRDPRSVGADTAPIALIVSTRHAGAARLDELREAIRRARTPEDRVVAVSALGSFADPALLRRALDLVLTDEIKIQDGLYVLSTANGFAEARPVLFAWIKEHFAELKKRTPSTLLTRLASPVAMMCTKELRDDAAAFFAEAFRDVDGGERALHQALETVDLCIDLRAREAARAAKRLTANR